jgi:hypothetical protein
VLSKHLQLIPIALQSAGQALFKLY